MKISLEKSLGELYPAQEVLDRLLTKDYSLKVRGFFGNLVCEWEACFEPGGEVVKSTTLADAVLAAAKAIKVRSRRECSVPGCKYPREVACGTWGFCRYHAISEAHVILDEDGWGMSGCGTAHATDPEVINYIRTGGMPRAGSPDVTRGKR